MPNQLELRQQQKQSYAMSKRSSKRKTENALINVVASGTNNVQTPVTRNKKGGGSVGNSGINTTHDLSKLEKMVPVAYPLDHPYNKDGYRLRILK
jgi:hypothetical protein